MYYILSLSTENGPVCTMLLHCGVQCSIISASIPSALIEERLPRNDRAGALPPGGTLGGTRKGTDARVRNEKKKVRARARVTGLAGGQGKEKVKERG